MSDKVEDLSLPNAVVARIIKEALPPGSIVAKVWNFPSFQIEIFSHQRTQNLLLLKLHHFSLFTSVKLLQKLHQITRYISATIK